MSDRNVGHRDTENTEVKKLFLRKLCVLCASVAVVAAAASSPGRFAPLRPVGQA
jgi:hypothetical protein